VFCDFFIFNSLKILQWLPYEKIFWVLSFCAKSNFLLQSTNYHNDLFANVGCLLPTTFCHNLLFIIICIFLLLVFSHIVCLPILLPCSHWLSLTRGSFLLLVVISVICLPLLLFANINFFRLLNVFQNLLFFTFDWEPHHILHLLVSCYYWLLTTPDCLPDLAVCHCWL